jgi:hypothetical protein
VSESDSDLPAVTPAKDLSDVTRESFSSEVSTAVLLGMASLIISASDTSLPISLAMRSVAANESARPAVALVAVSDGEDEDEDEDTATLTESDIILELLDMAAT